MKIETIPLGRKKLKGKPNLKNYNKIYKKFKWRHAYKELEFFSDGKINAAYNAIDRHLNTWRKNKVALYWEGETESREFSFLDMSELSNKFANVIKRLGVKKGDRCFIFLPRIPELYISFLGILKTGAIAGTMFSAFGPEGIRDRLENSEATVLVTNEELKSRVYEVIKDLPCLKHIIVVNQKTKKSKKELSFEEEIKKSSDEFRIAHMKPKEPAFMLYTSGTKGKDRKSVV